MTTEKWDGKTPDWELEPTGKEQQEAGVEGEPSVAESRIAEIAAETSPIITETVEQKVSGVESVRAEIAEMTKEVPAPIKTEASTPKSINMEQIELDTPDVEISGRSVLNKYDFQKTAIKEASGGLIEYVPSSKQNKFGYEFENGGTIPPEKISELKANLEITEKDKSKAAFDYLKIPEKAYGSEWSKDLKLNDDRGFSTALTARSMHNEDVRKKIVYGTVGTTAVVTAGGIAAAVIGGAGSTAALLGVTAIAAGGSGILVLGGIGWLGKKIYDSYKEKKAAKNFITASVAQNVRNSLNK